MRLYSRLSTKIAAPTTPTVSKLVCSNTTSLTPNTTVYKAVYVVTLPLYTDLTVKA